MTVITTMLSADRLTDPLARSMVDLYPFQCLSRESEGGQHPDKEVNSCSPLSMRSASSRRDSPAASPLRSIATTNLRHFLSWSQKFTPGMVACLSLLQATEAKSIRIRDKIGRCAV